MENKSFLSSEADKSIIFFSAYLDKLRRISNTFQGILNLIEPESEKKNIIDFDLLIEFNRLNSLIVISHLDLIVAVKGLNNAKHKWEGIYFIKSVYLTIYETLNTYKNYQKLLYNSVEKMFPELKEAFTKLNQDIKFFKKKYKYTSQIEEIRNNISGHINKNFEVYYDTVVSFNVKETVLMSISFFKIIQDIQNFSTLIMETEKQRIEDNNKRNSISINQVIEKIRKIQKLHPDLDLTEFEIVLNKLKQENGC